MRFIVWPARALLFFALFAFALNNQQTAVVRWFFGLEWQAPMVIVVLAAFAGGCVIGVLAMVPGWWRDRRKVKRLAPASPALGPPAKPPPAPEFGSEHPPRDGV
ncbi:MAG TPA: LapA family protein [Rubrivivax sp.]